jgi:hypothetical protein
LVVLDRQDTKRITKNSKWRSLVVVRWALFVGL